MSPPSTLCAHELYQRLQSLPVLDTRILRQNHCDTHALSDMEASNLAAAENAHNTLVCMGGRPTRTVQHDPGSWDPTEEKEEDLWLVRHYSIEGARFRAELESWELFRDYQRDIRKDSRIFVKTQEFIETYWQQKCIEDRLKPRLHIKPQMQTKVDEWKEFWFCQYRMRAPKLREVFKARKQAKSLLDGLQFTAIQGPRSNDIGAMSAGKRWIDMALNDLGKWDEWLAWITQQLPIICSEYASDRHQYERPHLLCKTPQELPGNDDTLCQPLSRGNNRSNGSASKCSPKNTRSQSPTLEWVEPRRDTVPRRSGRRPGRRTNGICSITRIKKGQGKVGVGGRRKIGVPQRAAFRKSSRIAQMQRSMDEGA